MKSNRFAVADKQTNIVEANHLIERNSFAKPNYYPTKEFILKLKQWVYKWVFKNYISVELRDYIVNNHATSGKNVPLYKTYKTAM